MAAPSRRQRRLPPRAAAIEAAFRKRCKQVLMRNQALVDAHWAAAQLHDRRAEAEGGEGARRSAGRKRRRARREAVLRRNRARRERRRSSRSSPACAHSSGVDDASGEILWLHRRYAARRSPPSAYPLNCARPSSPSRPAAVEVEGCASHGAGRSMTRDGADPRTVRSEGLLATRKRLDEAARMAAEDGGRCAAARAAARDETAAAPKVRLKALPLKREGTPSRRRRAGGRLSSAERRARPPRHNMQIVRPPAGDEDAARAFRVRRRPVRAAERGREEGEGATSAIDMKKNTPHSTSPRERRPPVEAAR